MGQKSDTYHFGRFKGLPSILKLQVEVVVDWVLIVASSRITRNRYVILTNMSLAHDDFDYLAERAGRSAAR